MYMDRLICLNWGNLPSRTYTLGPVTLLTGGSGAGKTTLADGMQTVMTAAKRNLYSYNPGQEEATQSGRRGKQPRTLESYILGADDNLIARPDGLVTGYVAIAFRPSPGELESPGFTAIVGARAFLDVAAGAGRVRRAARLETKRLLVVEDHLLNDADFVLSRENRQLKLVQIDAIYDHLRVRYGSAVSDFADSHKSYLSMLYGKLRGRTSVNSEQAERAARTFARFMAYKPIDSVDEFVRNDILERMDISADIAHIRTLIHDVNELRKESERLSGNVQHLKDAQHWGGQIDIQWRRQAELLLVRAYKGEHEAEQEIASLEAEHRALTVEGERLAREIEEGRRRARELDSQCLSLKGQLLQHQAAQERDKLESLIQSDLETAAQAMASVGTALAAAGRNVEAVRQFKQAKRRVREHDYLREAFAQADSAAREIEGFDVTVIGRLAETLVRAGDPDHGHCQKFAEALAGIDDAQQMLKLAVLDEKGLSDRVGELFGNISRDVTQLESDESTLKAQIDDLEHRQQVRYPKSVEEAIQAIRQSVPGCQPVVLCDVVEFRIPDWQSAVEGYLGANRFMLLVDPQYEARAIRTVRALNRRGANVAQVDMARKDLAAAGNLPTQSIVHLLDVKNPLAQAYLNASYGRVVQVPDAETLRHTARGLTEDGMGSSSYSMFSCHASDDDLVFGRSGRERQLKAKRQKLAETEVRRRDYQELRDDLQALRALLRRIEVLALERPAQQLLTAAQRVHERRGMLSQLDLSSVGELDAALKQVKKAQMEEQKAADVAIGRQGEIREKTKSLNDRLPQSADSLKSARAEIAQHQEQFAGLARVDERFRPDEFHTRLKLEARDPLLTYARIRDDLTVAQGAINNAKGRFVGVITTEYNPQAQDHERIALQPGVEAQQLNVWTDYYAYMEAQSQVRRQYKRQSEIRLADVSDRLLRTQQDVQNTFTANFCQMIYNAVRAGEDTLKSLNRDLRQHRFSEETYEFVYEFDPLYKRYFNFFEKVIGTEGLGEGRSLFGDLGLEPEHVTVRDELLGLLLGADEDKSKQKLAEITDYRNYRRYDILRNTGHGEPTPLSTWGSASGGQFETPSYVIRSAAAASAYRFEEGDTHLRVALIDETFSKMDERRAKEVLAMLTGTMRLQVIFVMPTMRAGPFHPLATHKLVFSKVSTPRVVGELKTMTLVSEQVVNREATERLFEQHRQQVRTKVTQQFIEIDP